MLVRIRIVFIVEDYLKYELFSVISMLNASS